MRKLLLVVIIFSSLSGCKKKAPNCNDACTCISTKNEQIPQQYADSATVYNLVLGNWYLRQDNVADTINSCNRVCYCDNNQYTFVFSSHNMLIRKLPDNSVDTVIFIFPAIQDTVGLFSTTGNYYRKSDSTLAGYFFYNGNYLTISNQNQYLSYPSFPVYTYYLTHN